jgi:hypothetical protein
MFNTCFPPQQLHEERLYINVAVEGNVPIWHLSGCLPDTTLQGPGKGELVASLTGGSGQIVAWLQGWVQTLPGYPCGGWFRLSPAYPGPGGVAVDLLHAVWIDNAKIPLQYRHN